MMEPKLQPSPILEELLSTLRTAAILPLPLRWLQPIVVRAAVDLVPEPLRKKLKLAQHGGLSRPGRLLLRSMASRIERMTIQSNPATQACLRLGLPSNYLTTPREQRLKASDRPPSRSPKPTENCSRQAIP